MEFLFIITNKTILHEACSSGNLNLVQMLKKKEIFVLSDADNI